MGHVVIASCPDNRRTIESQLQGMYGGQEDVTLGISRMAAHSHDALGTSQEGDKFRRAPDRPFATSNDASDPTYHAATSLVDMSLGVLGTIYGGDGYRDFGVPNLKGRAPIHSGSGHGPGTSHYKLGQMGGVPMVELQESQIPTHNHSLTVSMEAPTSKNPTGLFPARHEDESTRTMMYCLEPDLPLNSTFDSAAVAPMGRNEMHENRQPYLPLPFCIALKGIYPERP